MKPRFTPREFEILTAMSKGHDSTKQLAELFVLSPRTIQTHLDKIFDKTGIHKRQRLVIVAMRDGWLAPTGDGESGRAANSCSGGITTLPD